MARKQLDTLEAETVSTKKVTKKTIEAREQLKRKKKVRGPYALVGEDTLTLKVARVPPKLRPQGQRSYGQTTQLGFFEFVATIFYTNETLYKSRKLTDAHIQDIIFREFPNKKGIRQIVRGKGARKRTIGHYRSLYNGGAMTNGVKPEQRSYAYDNKGERVEKWVRSAYREERENYG